MGTCPTYPLGRRNYMGDSGTVQIGSEPPSGGGRIAAESPRGRPLGSALGPRPDLVDGPGRDDAFGRDAEPLGALAPERLHVELPRGVRVGVDGEEAAEVARQLDQLVRRIAPLGTRVDLDRHVVLEAGAEDLLGVELRRRTLAPAARHELARAVGEDVGVR